MRTAVIFPLTAAMLAGGAVAQVSPSQNPAPEQRSARESIRMYEITATPAVTILASADRTNRAEALDFVYNGENLELPSANAVAGSEAPTPPPPASEAPETPEE